jgi:mannose-6-phosphate isomerase-like protein (cupin superfamily)
MEPFAFSIADAVKQLQKETDKKFTVVMQHGSMQIEYFAPDKIDTQTPHTKDEIYVITSGSSSFYRNGETISCKTGDIIFVPAGMEHRFINFSDDFATWVIFYGPQGGEM